jgi:hypothetical protein
MRASLVVASPYLVFFACVGDSSVTPNDSGIDSTSPTDASSEPSPGLDAAGDSSDAGAWTPAVLDGENRLALWLAAAPANVVLSGGNVGTWRDLSHRHNDGINSVGGPAYVTGAINGHDAIHFTGTGGNNGGFQIADATSLHFGTDQIYLVVVAAADPTKNGGYFYSKATTTLGMFGPQYVSGLEFYTDQSSGLSVAAHMDTMTGGSIQWTSAVFTDSTFHIVSLRRSGLSLTLTVDHQAPLMATTNFDDLTVDGGTVEIVATHYGATVPNIDLTMAELIIVRDAGTGVIADADIASIETYLQTKYNL